VDAQVSVTLLLSAAVAAVVGVAAVLVVGRAVRRAAERGAARMVEEQVAGMARVSSQLTETVDRFHAQLGELGRQLSSSQSAAGEALQRTLTDQLQSMSQNVTGQLAASQRVLGDGLAGATSVFGSVQAQLGQVAEMAARMETLAGSLEELGGILKVPKLRGLMGEQTLESLLGQVLPRRLWAVQHRFSDGRTVDAVVRLGDGLLPVDAKFPLESFRRMQQASDEVARRSARSDFVRAVKLRVDEIAARYLRPDEGTLDFALMFIPAEGVYAEVVTDAAGEDLLSYALDRRVLPVSPATIFAYLSTVASALRGIEVEAQAQEIVRGLAALEHDLKALEDELSVLGKHLHNSVQRHAEVERGLASVRARLARLGTLGGSDGE
jgi:DNA recombination protein RmuC